MLEKVQCAAFPPLPAQWEATVVAGAWAAILDYEVQAKVGREIR